MNKVIDEEAMEKNTEMCKREDVPNSPFVVVTVEEGSFGTLGKWRITEIKQNSAEVFDELSTLSWNRIIQVMTLLMRAKDEGLINKEDSNED